MKILLTGRAGQVGSALVPALAPLGEVSAFDRRGLDLLDPQSIRSIIAKARPDVIVNAAAYTAVDRAQAERDAAFAVNAAAVGVLAEEARKRDALLVHFSTDYVFDGGKTAPYVETDTTGPLGVYGESKLAGERAVTASGCRHFTFRTSWVYGPGGRNFVYAILAAAKNRPELRVVNDQHGAPTSSEAIARAVARILSSVEYREKPSGIYHLSAAGRTTWYEFALEMARVIGVEPRLIKVRVAEMKLRAKRPLYCALSNDKLRSAGVDMPAWQDALARYLTAPPAS